MNDFNDSYTVTAIGKSRRVSLANRWVELAVVVVENGEVTGQGKPITPSHRKPGTWAKKKFESVGIGKGCGGCRKRAKWIDLFYYWLATFPVPHKLRRFYDSNLRRTAH